uniref:Uncharacterized protein n=1 Tax=Anguilla anguilla TaxID=7936 RepID=A0A0E9QUK6_ANGAN
MHIQTICYRLIDAHFHSLPYIHKHIHICFCILVHSEDLGIYGCGLPI